MTWRAVVLVGLVAAGCGTATNVAPTDGDAGARDAGGMVDVSQMDGGLSLEDRQFEAANTLVNEMAQGVREMQAQPGAVSAAFMSAARAWDDATRTATTSIRSDASLSDRRSADVRIAVEVRFPAYCQMRAALPGFTPSIVPRLRCDEVPVMGAWWERYP